MRMDLMVGLCCGLMFGCDTSAHYDEDFSSGGSTGNSGKGGASASGVCRVGQARSCNMPNGSKGEQYCYEDGSRFGNCRSIASPSGSTTGGRSSIGGSSSRATTTYSSGGMMVTTQPASSSGGSVIVTTVVIVQPGTTCTDCDGDGVAANRDCNDGNPAISPNRSEICGNGIDENCDGIDASCSSSSFEDADGDGDPASSDCNDYNALIHHGRSEICNNNFIDDDCDGFADETDPEC